MTERDTCHMLRTVMFGTLASLAISTAAQAQNSPDEATRIAQSAVVSYLAAFGQHDAKGIANLFVPDGVFLPANGAPVVKGRDAIEHTWTELFKTMGGQESIIIKDVIPVGADAVVAINQFMIVGEGANANKTISGRAAITLAKTPNGWQYVSVVHQNDQPPPK